MTVSCRVQIVDPFPWRLRQLGLSARTPPRPKEHRQVDYDQKFDRSTLWYDGFWDATGRVAIFVGPPMLNVRPEVETIAFVERDGKELVAESLELDRCAITMVDCGEALERNREESLIASTRSSQHNISELSR